MKKQLWNICVSETPDTGKSCLIQPEHITYMLLLLTSCEDHAEQYVLNVAEEAFLQHRLHPLIAEHLTRSPQQTSYMVN